MQLKIINHSYVIIWILVSERKGIIMGVQFVLGEASKDHKKEMLNQLKDWQKQDSTAQFFYLVPEHIKFESEVNVLSTLQAATGSDELFATANVQVFSFTRLAWYFLRNSAVLNRQNLSQTGLTMLITHLLNQVNQDELVIFSEEQNQPGFAEKLANQLLELRMSGYEVEDLQKLQAAAAKKHQANLADKLADLATIYQRFLDYQVGDQNLLDAYLDPVKLLQLLENYLQQADLSNCYFMISGFDEFNATELKIITTLMQQANQVMISLPLSDYASKQIPQTNDLFYRPSKLYHQLRKLAHGQTVSVIWPKHERVSSSLIQLENYWMSAHDAAFNAEYDLKAEQKDNITITQTVDRISEVKWVAAKIRRMVAESQQTDHPYQYSDFLVMTPNPEKYQNLIEPIFNQFNLPLFTDLTQSMTAHPLVEFLLSIFDVQRHGFNYQSIMRFLKTELFVPEQIIAGKTLTQMKEREAEWVKNHPGSTWSFDKDATELRVRQTATFRNTLDVVENYLLEKGIHTLSQWKTEWIVTPLGLKQGETETQLHERERQLTINRNANELRKQVVKLFEDYQQRMQNVKTGRDFATVLFQFMEDAHVAETLSSWQKAAINIQQEQHTETEATLHGTAVDASRPQQVWDVFCNLMDEYVFALGDEEFDAQLFVTIFQNGFESANYKRVPSTLDQIIFSKTSVLQMQNRKVSFIIGATDDVMPARLDENKLLSEDDRDILNSMKTTAKIADDKFLPETCELKMAEEPFTNYLAFMSCSESLHFVYPVNDVDGSELQISPYVQEIKDAFNLPIHKVALTAPNLGPEILDYVGNATTTTSELLNLSRKLKHDHEKLSLEWTAIFNYIKSKHRSRIIKIFNSLNYQNEVLPAQQTDEEGHKKLDEQLVAELYGQQINGSISRLETFYQNPYEYFLKYGLKLKKRTLYEPTSANVGDYFHDVVALLIDELQARNLTLSTLSSDEFDDVLSQVFIKVNALPEFEVFNQTARNRYLQGRLQQSAQKVSRAIYRQHHQRKIFSLKSEATFGFGNDAVLEGKKFHALNHPQDKLLLQGRLDRIDLVEDAQNKLYYNVADYKSGQIGTKLDKFLIKSLNGISLQLLTYLAVLRDNQEAMLQMLNTNKVLAQQLKDAKKNPIDLGSAVYFHLGTPQYKQEKYKAADQKTAQAMSDKEFIYDGIFRFDQQDKDGLDYIKALGTVYDQGNEFENLNNYKLNLTKKGILSAASKNKVYNAEQFNQLLNMDLLKISQATDAIFAGIIDLTPFKLGNLTGLDYSDYLPIMTFDTLIGNQYNDLTGMVSQKKEDLWNQVEQASKRWKAIRNQVEGKED